MGALNSKQKNEMGLDRNEPGRGSNDGSVLEWVWVMGSIYIGCRQRNISFSLFFLSLSFLQREKLSSLSSLLHLLRWEKRWSEKNPTRWLATLDGGAAAVKVQTPLFFTFSFFSLLLFFLKLFLALKFPTPSPKRLDLKSSK